MVNRFAPLVVTAPMSQHRSSVDVPFDTRFLTFKLFVMASRAAHLAARQVKPIMSLDQGEARKRAINLYRAWYKQIPFIVRHFDIPKSIEQCQKILREEFVKYENITDVRVIDMLIIKGQMELQESVNNWKQKGHIMSYFKETIEPKPKDFLSKFIQGID